MSHVGNGINARPRYGAVEEKGLGAVELGPRRDLLKAALDCFAAKGFHATTTREIAQRAGLSPAAVYVHYASKEELLYLISVIGHEDVQAATAPALDGATNPIRRVHGFVLAFARWHAENHTMAKVIQYELGALTPEHRREVGRLRAWFEGTLKAEIVAGARAGLFDTHDAEGATLAALSLCIDIARWYSRRSAWSPDQLAERYAELVLRMLGSC
jgi:AcrR family transcriptional regulator